MLNGVREFLAKLDAAIDDTMQGPVTDGAKKAIQESTHSNVYGAYSPEFESRRMEGGGIADPGNMTANYGGKTLVITDDAPWQQLYGGTVPGGKLSEAIASGDARYNMGKAGPRPFMSQAEQDYAGSGQFSQDMAAGLRTHGFKVI